MKIAAYVILAILLIVVGGLGAGYWQYTRALQQPLNLTVETIVDVPAGSSSQAALMSLERQGIIHNAFWLKLYWRFVLNGHSIKTGEYKLSPGMDIQTLMAHWVKGEVVSYKITLVEGWTFKQVREALVKQEALKQTISQMSNEQIMSALNEQGKSPEGLFFPDTYVYIRGNADLDILRRANKRLHAVLEEEWSNKADNLPYQNAYQALIMASLIEKETGVGKERPQISGVFVRRLEKNMLLQTDPTVIYGMGERYNGKLARSNLKEYTPYNTYVIAGLPPTPIAIVGRESIHAALHPAKGTALYFVAKGDGSHEFSDDLSAHNQAVRKYQLQRRADYRSSPSPDIKEQY